MKTTEVVSFYGTQTAVAAALGIYQSSIAEWGDEPPDLRQIQLEKLTDGALKADPRCYGLPHNGRPRNSTKAAA